MVNTVNFIRFFLNGVYILVEVSFYISTTWLVSLLLDLCESPRANVAKLYG